MGLNDLRNQRNQVHTAEARSFFYLHSVRGFLSLLLISHVSFSAFIIPNCQNFYKKNMGPRASDSKITFF